MAEIGCDLTTCRLVAEMKWIFSGGSWRLLLALWVVVAERVCWKNGTEKKSQELDHRRREEMCILNMHDNDNMVGGGR